MFNLKVDDSLRLMLVEESLTEQYVDLLASNFEHLSKWLQWPYYVKTGEDFLGFVKTSKDQFEKGEAIHCAMIFNGKLAGNVSLNNINHDLKKVVIGYWLAKEYTNNGLVTKSVNKLIEYCFDELNIEKIQIEVAVENRASRKVCERLNMKLEGVITNQEKIGDGILDHAIYALHKSQIE